MALAFTEVRCALVSMPSKEQLAYLAGRLLLHWGGRGLGKWFKLELLGKQ